MTSALALRLTRDGAEFILRIISAHCGRGSRSIPSFFFLLLLLLLLFLTLCLCRSIKPFSQQAYSMQTAGTTTISGERRPGVIISFLPREHSLPPTPLARRGVGFFFSHLAPTLRFTVNPNTVRSKRKARKKNTPAFSLFF